MSRFRPFTMVVSIIAILGLLSSAALGGSWAPSDDPGNNTPPFIASNADTWPNTTCDTIDPITTAERSKVAYKCVDIQPTVAGADGYFDLTTASMETIDSDATPDGSVPLGHAGNRLRQKLSGEQGTPAEVLGRDTIKMTFKTSGPIPSVGAQSTDELLAAGLGGFLFQFAFQVPAKMNKRQIIGDTIDCQRYAHMGPWFTGDKMWWALQYQLTVEHGLVRQEAFQLVSDPGGFPFGGFLIQADPADTVAPATRSCNNGAAPQTPGPLTSFEGTRWSATRPDSNTLVFYVPMKWRWVDNQRNPYTMTFMSENDSVQNIVAIAGGTVNTASTPTVGPVGGQGLQNQINMDWIPWTGFRLANLTNTGTNVPPGGLFPAAALVGPTCPHFWAAEFVSGGGRHNTGGAYVPLGKGPGSPPSDRDSQANPLYGLGNYDASGEQGVGHGFGGGAPYNDTPVLGNQGHNGLNTCYVHFPDQGGVQGGGTTGSFTA